MHLKGAAETLFVLLVLPIAASAQVGLNVDVETAVRVKFTDAPVMIDIARCESKFRQYTDAGNPLRGGAGGTMIGVFQISEGVHADYAKSLGMDIYTLDGNLAYAKKLYKEEGTQPWISSFPCWGKDSDAETQTSGDLTMNLSLGMENPQVLLLQKTLNAKGYVIAQEGPGSPGNETQKFGALTRAAVKKFQCEQMQICDGDEYTNGFGFVGAKTRAALATSAPPSEASTTPVQSDELNSYSPEQQEQIKALQAQIVELTKTLSALLAHR